MWSEIADALTYRYQPANFFNPPYPGNNTTPEAFAEADNDRPEAPSVRDGPDAPISGFPASLQPNFATGETTKRAVAVTKRSTNKARRGLIMITMTLGNLHCRLFDYQQTFYELKRYRHDMILYEAMQKIYSHISNLSVRPADII
jgi:hypothetical protein